MFRFVSLFTIVLMASTQFTVGSNLYGASLHAPITSITSGQYGQGHGGLANSVISRNLGIPAASVISSHNSAIVHRNSAVSLPTISRSIPYSGQQQYIAAPLTHQSYSSPLISGGLYGQNGLHANSYAVQRSYTAPLAASGYSARGLYTSPIVATPYGAPLGQAHAGIISGH